MNPERNGCSPSEQVAADNMLDVIVVQAAGFSEDKALKVLLGVRSCKPRKALQKRERLQSPVKPQT